MFLGFADPISWHLIRIRIDENQFGFLDARYCRPLPTGLIYIQRQGHELVAMLPGHWSGCGKIGKCDLTIRIDQARKASVQITCQQTQQTLHCFCCSGTLPQCSYASAVPTSSPSHFSVPAHVEVLTPSSPRWNSTTSSTNHKCVLSAVLSVVL